MEGVWPLRELHVLSASLVSWSLLGESRRFFLPRFTLSPPPGVCPGLLDLRSPSRVPTFRFAAPLRVTLANGVCKLRRFRSFAADFCLRAGFRPRAELFRDFRPLSFVWRESDPKDEALSLFGRRLSRFLLIVSFLFGCRRRWLVIFSLRPVPVILFSFAWMFWFSRSLRTALRNSHLHLRTPPAVDTGKVLFPLVRLGSGTKSLSCTFATILLNNHLHPVTPLLVGRLLPLFWSPRNLVEEAIFKWEPGFCLCGIKQRRAFTKWHSQSVWLLVTSKPCLKFHTETVANMRGKLVLASTGVKYCHQRGITSSNSCSSVCHSLSHPLLLYTAACVLICNPKWAEYCKDQRLQKVSYKYRFSS